MSYSVLVSAAVILVLNEALRLLRALSIPGQVPENIKAKGDPQHQTPQTMGERCGVGELLPRVSRDTRGVPTNLGLQMSQPPRAQRMRAQVQADEKEGSWHTPPTLHSLTVWEYRLGQQGPCGNPRWEPRTGPRDHSRPSPGHSHYLSLSPQVSGIPMTDFLVLRAKEAGGGERATELEDGEPSSLEGWRPSSHLSHSSKLESLPSLY